MAEKVVETTPAQAPKTGAVSGTVQRQRSNPKKAVVVSKVTKPVALKLEIKGVDTIELTLEQAEALFTELEVALAEVDRLLK